jgi:cytochrome c-type biogenesis protein CcmF|tara:strand:- start:33258 stop:35255 length:1998 start_codon:yes stop_codon:yes gene_type:complete
VQLFEINLGQLGSGSTLLATALALYGAIAGIFGCLRHDARLQTSARLSAVATFLATTLAIVLMEAALLSDDFSVQYVAEQSRIASPVWVKVVTLWAALEGSVLLWAWLLTLYGAILAVTAPLNTLRPWALVIMQLVQVFFLGVVATAANPFVVLALPPLDGPGPNPLLQNHWMMAIHPVLLYLGFVGLTVPFAYAMAALIVRNPGSEWMTQTRRWTLTGWGFLSAGVIAGGWWSYEVLGWGGYWAWDPVENVSLLPWLTATAFIHSVQVQQRRHMLKAWNALLITLTFALSILGTFLIRSGIISSVHAFGDGPVGPIFLVFFVVVVITAFGLIALRWDQVRDRAELDATVSRESSILAGNLFFLAIAFTILLGTLFPLIVEAISGNKVTVGAPFFDQVTLPLWMLVLFLMGIGPLLPWRRANNQKLWTNLTWLIGGGLIVGLIGFALGLRGVYPLLTLGLAGYNIISLVLLLLGVIVPRAKISKQPIVAILRSYPFENRRRFGSMIVHFGIVVVSLGVMASSAFRIDEQVRLDFGTAVPFQAYELIAIDHFMRRTPRGISAGAEVLIERNGKRLATLRPRLNMFGQNSQLVPSPAVLYRFQHDLYLSIASTIDPDADFVVIRAIQSPLIAWIWVGGLIVVLGTGFALYPTGETSNHRKKSRKLKP